MKTLRNIWLLLWALCLYTGAFAAETIDYGLYFNAQKVTANSRTSLLLDNGESYKVKNTFSLRFDMLLRSDESAFGGVAHLTLDGRQALHFMLASDEDNKTYPALIFNDNMVFFHTPLVKDRWVRVGLTLDCRRNAVRLSYAGRDTTFTIPLQGTGSVAVMLGRAQGFVSDVVPMIVRDLRIGQDGRQTRFWKLGRHSGNTCYDELDHAAAVATAPRWQIDNHINWRLVYSTTTSGPVDVAFDPVKAQFYIVRSDAVEAYNDRGHLTEKYAVRDKYPVTSFFAHCLYDVARKQLITYSMHSLRVSRFSFAGGLWSTEDKQKVVSTHYNHAMAFNAADSSYYFFGGYGLYRYRNEVYRLAPGANTLERIKYAPAIPPRFAAAMAVVNNKLYILGGRGNQIGRQAVESYFYYDLWEIDLRTHHARRLWDARDKVDNIGWMLSSSMIYNPKDGCFYVVNMNDQGGRLLRFNRATPGFTVVSHSILNGDSYQDFDYNLFYSPTQNKLFLLVEKIQNDGKHKIYIYSLNTPLLDDAEISQDTAEGRSWRIAIVIAVLAAVAAGAVIIVVRRRRRKAARSSECARPEAETAGPRKEEDENPQKEEDEDSRKEEDEAPRPRYFDRSRAAVSLLGGFNVHDKNGNDITPSFTPRLKDMFLLLVLYTDKSPRGLSVKRLSEILWFDKDESQARNNRNVTVRKLRILLEEVGHIELVSENGFMRIVWGDDVFCDYHTLQECLRAFDSGDGADDNDLFGRLQELMLFGPLLPGVSVDWLDDFKAQNSEASIDLLKRMLDIEKRKNHPAAQLRIADIIFLHDPLSEEALAAKCQVLFSQGKKGLAKNVYDRFCREYKASIGEDFDVPFAEIEKE